MTKEKLLYELEWFAEDLLSEIMHESDVLEIYFVSLIVQ